MALSTGGVTGIANIIHGHTVSTARSVAREVVSSRGTRSSAESRSTQKTMDDGTVMYFTIGLDDFSTTSRDWVLGVS